MIRTRVQVRPEDHGRRISLEDFAGAGRADVWAEKKLSSTDALRTALLPGFEVRVADLFKLPPSPAKKRRRNGRKDG